MTTSAMCYLIFMYLVDYAREGSFDKPWKTGEQGVSSCISVRTLCFVSLCSLAVVRRLAKHPSRFTPASSAGVWGGSVQLQGPSPSPSPSVPPS